MHIALIAPKDSLCGPGIGWWNHEFLSFMQGKNRYGLARLSLPTLAAFVPRDVSVAIIDENVEEIDYDQNVDLVGITFYTAMATRAYAIADQFRNRGIKVVLGGMHASVLPDEAIRHADSVVIGEAEEVWPQVINDAHQNTLRQFYRAAQPPSLESSPLPRWELVRRERYSTLTLQTTRGCPYDCEFCSIKAFMGSKFRCKPVAQVISEVNNLVAMGSKLFFFSDDNLVGNRAYSMTLLKEIVPLKITYQTQMPIGIAHDDELLALLAESGCKRTIVGLESVSNANLRHMGKHKSFRSEEYVEAVHKIQSFGIEVFGSFILGCDHDDETVFENTAKLVQDSNMALAAFNILTPYPGTRLCTRLEQEKRILHKDWSLYDSMHVCFEPKLMSAETLQKGFYWIHQEVYSYDAIFKRLKGIWSLWNTTEIRQWDRVSPLLLNLNYNNVASSYPRERVLHSRSTESMNSGEYFCRLSIPDRAS